MNDAEWYGDEQQSEFVRCLVAEEIGLLVLSNWEKEKINLIPLIENRSIMALQKIAAIMDEDEEKTSDFQCIEKIIGVLAECGIRTYRHDY